MIGLIFVILGTLFSEASDSIGKEEVKEKKESIYTMGFLNLFWGAIGLVAIGLFKNTFVFSLSSLPTFLPRVLLEVAQAHISVMAICQADRSTFGFIRVLTIPLLLTVDIFLGYKIEISQLIGLTLIALALVFFFLKKNFDKKGAWLTLFTTVNAVATISLYKYNISHFNSIEAEQSLVYLVLMAYFFLTAYFISKENPFRLLIKPVFFWQSTGQGIGGILESFAYAFAPASLILGAKRASSVAWAVLSGGTYFKETRMAAKISCLILIIIGIILFFL